MGVARNGKFFELNKQFKAKSRNLAMKEVIYILVALILFAVKKNKPRNLLKEDVLMPLKIGNSWTYLFVKINPQTGDTVESSIGTLVIVKKVTTSGAEWLMLNDNQTVGEIKAVVW